jgi:hypothetical protein
MYYTLWRRGSDFPEPYTFNTTSLDDIRNYLAWEIVDSNTSGNEDLKGSNISSYNLNEIDWDQYDSTVEDITNLIVSAQSKCTDESISNYKTFPDSEININVSDQFTLVISEGPFNPENCYGKDLEWNEFMFGQKPWN